MSPSSPNREIGTGLPPRHRIVIAIDYGTTYSGLSYAISNAEKGTEYGIGWPRSLNTDSLGKIPTKIAYKAENLQSLQTDTWGYAVGADSKSCSWTKLLLDKSAFKNRDDEVGPRENIDEGMMHLPPNRTANGVCEDFLHAMYVHFVNEARQRVGTEAFDMSPMDYWITLPAIWSDEAKQATLDAAKGAGFAKNSMDQIRTIAEPEAAAIATLQELATSGSLDAVQLEFKELYIGAGEKCGSTFIDRRLHFLLSERFGNAFKDLPCEKKGPDSKFMNAWEFLKRDFGHDINDMGTFDLGPLKLNSPSSKHYDDIEHVVHLSCGDMKHLFDPIINQILDLVRSQTKQAKRQRNAEIDSVGLGVRSICTKGYNHGAPQTGMLKFYALRTLLRGARIRGLEEIAPFVKYARRHYGFRIALPFRRFTYDTKHAFIDEFTERLFCAGRMGDGIIEGFYHREGCTASYTPGEEVTGVQEIGQITFHFKSDFDFDAAKESRFIRRLKKYVYQFHFDVQVVFGDKGANLKFRIAVNGRVIATVPIKFTDR
ncbi:hypothetical protein SS1G_11589 [Sclerotinia sclerotiorum 1980 UF-70]|uniref:Hsp70 family protein n=1 Tax=Sclerotinia sclerotiorum (strain ATCC 18683 / 1980 / Ss-1) TaxID=665079 RepID=A7F1W8_SCLS1|nr:hypothetical protein SS1G_11589 [Sclerotinia sclerotiorum 1980 UF-70]EDN95710.1 hypothetical protein SS1G_11589 [Sclerotinia sclerotiorum 1980 UF-70]